jgi:ubiquitin carboxyl-terminal hydrolase 36/42
MGSGKGAVLRGGEASQTQEQHALIVPDYPSPSGLTNVGNSCYANAALQCLLNTALTDALLEPKTCDLFRRYASNPNILSKGSGSVDESDDDESVIRARQLRREERRNARDDKSRMQETCTWLTDQLTSITQDYTQKGFSETESSASSFFPFLPSTMPTQQARVVDPGNITRQPHLLSRTLRPYQQEDAHEFLRALLSTLVMNGHNKQLSSLFDGLLESAVTFQGCRHTSLTRDRYMDLSLDISHDYIKTLPDALEEFTKTEMLDCDNMVLCEKCGEKQQVSKGLRLATAPSILVCHLKRFAVDHYGRLRRLHKHVQIPLRLDIGDYMSKVNKATPPSYELVGVLVHQGRTCNSGHYLSYVKSGEDWFKTNDSVVTKVDVSAVLKQQAYIVLYEVAGMRAKHKVSKMLNAKKNCPQERPATPETVESWDQGHSSEEEREGRHDQARESTASSLLSMLCQANPLNFVGDFCCGPIDSVVSPSPGESDVRGDGSASVSTTRKGRSPTQRRKQFRSKRSCSSSNLRELEKEAVASIPARLPVRRSRTRNHSFSNHSDPGGKLQVRFHRRSKSARGQRSSGKYETSLPPLPN